MRPSLLILCVFILPACQPARTSVPFPPDSDAFSAWTVYGDPGFTTPQPRGFNELRSERNVRVSGTITRVSDDGASWFELISPTGDTLLLRPLGRRFTLPASTVGQRAMARGRSERRLLSVDEQMYFARQRGAADEQLLTITRPESQVTFFAEAVAVENRFFDAAAPDSGASSPDILEGLR